MFKPHLIRLVVILFLSATTAFAADDFAWPPDDPDQWLLAIVDVETTGLTPGHHEMIDIGLIYTDLEGNELGRVAERVWPEHPERCSPGAAAVNGFSVERWDSLGALSKAELVQRITAMHESVVADGQQVMLVALNSHFDSAFLDHLFRDTGGSWRDLWFYFVLDLPSMAWGAGYGGLTGANLSAALGIEDEPHTALDHTGITGAAVNLRIYRALREAHPAMFPPSR